jgi:hypothetical protein
MATTPVVEPLSPELEAIATVAAQRLRAQVGENEPHAAEAQQAMIAAASGAMAAGVSLGEIAAAEQAGQNRAREELGNDLLRAVERAARRRREIEHEYEQSVQRAARIGLAHSDIATAAQTARGTIRTIVSRTNGATPTPAPAPADGQDDGTAHEQP